jgi:transmembrane sensor
VTMTGEAYFEVASLPLTPSGGGGTKGRMPFIVDVDGKAEVEVLGTHFNVDAYDNNTALSTTLLEGLVKVNGTTITPGQQARITNVLKVVNNADTEKVMAWKNGLFNFEGATLEEVMKQLERWYDIEVVYEKGVPDIEFGGEMTKNISLKGLLLVLEKSDIHFRLEGRRLIVLP